MRTACFLLLATLCAACESSPPRLLVPEVPANLWELPPEPVIPEKATERAVAIFLIEQEHARAVCYGNLLTVRDILAEMRGEKWTN